MSITVRAMRALMLALLLMFTVGATAGALSFADARPAMADDGDDDGRGDGDDDGRDDGDDDGRDGDDDGRDGDDDGRDDDDDDRAGVAGGGEDRFVPQGGVQTGAGGMASGTMTAMWTLGGAGLLAGVGAVATWLLSRRGSEDL